MALPKYLSFKNLHKELSKCFSSIPDHRQNEKVKHSVHDACMSAFACMYFQDPSLLQFQKRMQKKRHTNNLKTLFKVSSIPESTQIRDILDEVDSAKTEVFFKKYVHHLQKSKHLESFQLLPTKYFIALDGTNYFSSTSISCESCLRSQHKVKSKEGLKEVTRYAHKVLQAAIMHPEKKEVIPLAPEEIDNTHEKTKQDCELNAAKRLVPKLRKQFPRLGMILGGDALFATQSLIEEILWKKMHYLFVVKPLSHAYLHEWLKAYPTLNRREVKERKTGRRHEYIWMNDVPLHGQKEAIQVNYLHYAVYKKDNQGEEKVIYKNSWCTDIELTGEDVIALAQGGRCRWKIENECFNTLKNQGYAIDHSYGHGQKHLSFNFYLLTLIAFSFHQVFELTDKLYQTCRKELGSKKNLWEHIRAYLKVWVFTSWEMLLNFTCNPEYYIPDG